METFWNYCPFYIFNIIWLLLRNFKFFTACTFTEWGGIQECQSASFTLLGLLCVRPSTTCEHLLLYIVYFRRKYINWLINYFNKLSTCIQGARVWSYSLVDMRTAKLYTCVILYTNHTKNEFFDHYDWKRVKMIVQKSYSMNIQTWYKY